MFCNLQSKRFVGLLFVCLFILKYFIHFDANVKLTSFPHGSQTIEIQPIFVSRTLAKHVYWL